MYVCISAGKAKTLFEATLCGFKNNLERAVSHHLLPITHQLPTQILFRTRVSPPGVHHVPDAGPSTPGGGEPLQRGDGHDHQGEPLAGALRCRRGVLQNARANLV